MAARRRLPTRSPSGTGALAVDSAWPNAVDVALPNLGKSDLMHLTHLGLPVLEAGRSLGFYSTYFGFDPATAQRYPDGTVIIRNADGFDLALHAEQDPGAPQPFMHFGFHLDSGDEVRRGCLRVMAAPLRLEDLEVTELHQTQDPEVVIAEMRTKGTLTATGRSFVATSIQVLRIREGQIVLFRDFADSRGLADVIGGRRAGG